MSKFLSILELFYNISKCTLLIRKLHKMLLNFPIFIYNKSRGDNLKSGMKILQAGYLEKQLIELDYDIKWISYLNAGANRKSPTEIVSNYRLIMFIEGLAKVRILGEEYYVGKGDSVLFPPGSLYNAIILNEGPCQFISIEFLFYNPGHSMQFRQMLGLKNIAVYSKVVPDDTLHSLIRIYEKADNQEPISIYRVRLLLDDVIAHIVFRQGTDMKRVANLNKSVSADEIVAKCHEYIINHKEENVKIEDICRRLNISRSYIYQCVKTVMNMPAKDFVVKVKMNIAQRDLLQTGKSISQIAHENGYSTQNQFSAIFKKNYGLSPSEYRKSNREM